MKHLLASCLLMVLAAFPGQEPGTVTGNDGPKGPAAYYLVGGDAASVQKETVSVVQKDKTFQPGLVSVAVGGTVEFPNQDDLVHNVYSPKGAIGFVDMGSSKKTAADKSNLLSHTMEQQGAVHLSGAIHPIMQAVVFVVPSRYHTTSDDGTYTFSKVPAGTYDLMVMSPDGTTSKLKELTVN